MLTVEQFSAFVAEVHRGRRPFPWQVALLARVAEEGWPDVIDVPTGLGKTSVLDVAVFAAALGVAAARRRIFYVVDRRLVVDEAFTHARRLARAVTEPGDRPVTAAVADRLRLAGDDTPLDVTRMRGGVTWDSVWLDRPDRYAIVTGTVDQVGSRLFFRGYGVGEHSRSIDAGLVGADSLIVVDEAHLAPAFVASAQEAVRMDRSPVARPPQFVVMSATVAPRLSSTEPRIHRIGPDDESDDIAGKRLRAAKRMHLVEVGSTKASVDAKMAEAMAGLATTTAGAGGVVGVVVNTVARARAVFALVREKYEALLLTGRSRQVSRDYLLATYYPRISVDRDRRQRRPLIVVATQTVEVGANIDFDALVTESAPVASLVQRLGRLNRMAEVAGSPAPAIVVHEGSAGEDDPVYGRARNETWRWLVERVGTPVRYSSRIDPSVLPGGLDVSPAALRDLVAEVPAARRDDLLGPQPYVPVLERRHLDTWVRTSPVPVPDQPVEPFLHGVRDESAAVSVVWRDLPDDPNRWANLVDEIPPVAEEAIELSVVAVRRWLRDRSTVPDITDLDHHPATDDEGERRPPQIGQVLRYRRRDGMMPVPPSGVRPGDTIVVPAAVGGCDQYGWCPGSTEPVLDVADLALRHGRPILRLGDPLLRIAEQWHPEAVEPIGRLFTAVRAAVEAGDFLDKEKCRRVLDEIRGIVECGTADPDSVTPVPPLRAVLDALPSEQLAVYPTADRRPQRDANTTHVGIVGRKQTRSTGGDPEADTSIDWPELADDDTAAGSSASTPRTELDNHQRAVARRAGEIARNLALPPAVVRSVILAARWHDEGKRDPRCQVMLWQGNHVAASIAGEILAKSGMDPTDRTAFADAREAAGYPRGMRHEALSARIAAARLLATDDADPDLVVHLVASHHGRARPILPPVTDPQPVPVEVPGVGVFDSGETVDWHQPLRFAQLNERYGRWGLALMEAVVRLADIWCSIRNEKEEEEP